MTSPDAYDFDMTDEDWAYFLENSWLVTVMWCGNEAENGKGLVLMPFICRFTMK